MKKQEFDTIELVFSTKKIPNTEEIDSSDNAEWWKKTYHETDEEAKRPEMYNHAIAFDGTRPVALRDIHRGTEKHFSSTYFTSTCKQRK